LTCLTMDSYTSKEGWYHINRFNHGDLYVRSERAGIPLTGLSMEIYMSREGWDPINRFNHGDVYVKRGLVSH